MRLLVLALLGTASAVLSWSATSHLIRAAKVNRRTRSAWRRINADPLHQPLKPAAPLGRTIQVGPPVPGVVLLRGLPPDPTPSQALAVRRALNSDDESRSTAAVSADPPDRPEVLPTRLSHRGSRQPGLLEKRF